MSRRPAAAPWRALTAALAGAAATGGAAHALAARPPGGTARWARTNHRGEPLTLLEGPATVLGAAAGVALAPGLPRGARAAALTAVLGAGALGAYDDLAGDGDRRGLAGHLGALAHGRVTTGAVKVLGLAATGTVAAALAGGASSRGRARPAARVADVLVGGAVVAGSANLLNLLDLRPGRALKATLLAAAPGLAVADPLAAAAAGAAVAALPADLGERSMLGDTGANALGALLGATWVARSGPRGRAVALAALTALTLASERVAFTAVIERTPVLRELDRLGRRPRT
ncbi:hypothetical protein GCM10025868_05790 [Angustibacter aerolatus]|uniref:Glycosyl transferase n=1 Tax=Angustibacter aerolatus TaxID=1162965 RepID=A0ABQ6JD19_9ACTN|nr:hypothetical protein GCM10025868_05790 [Angustibacter aerolatus]